MQSQKHLIQCQCILSQFKNTDPPIFHSFIVFSVLEEDGSLIPAYAQCNNCNVIHKVLDICRSEILKKEEMFSLETEDDLKFSIPEKLVQELQRNQCPLYVWQELSFIFENEQWKKGIQNVVIATDTIEDNTVGKYISVRGKDTFVINKFSRKDVINL